MGWGYRENGERVRTAHALHEGDGFLGFAVDCRSSEKKKSSLHNLFSLQNPSSQQPPRPLSPRERVRERATSRKACIWVVKELGDGCRNSRNALSSTLPHRGGNGLQQIQALQVV